MVRLEKINDVADNFVRVRLTRIDGEDLNLFEFDYDLTFMVFFLNAEEQVYARYGGRDAKDADNRLSLAGLRYTMQSVLQMHQREQKEFAPRSHEAPKYARDFAREVLTRCDSPQPRTPAQERAYQLGWQRSEERYRRYLATGEWGPQQQDDQERPDPADQQED